MDQKREKWAENSSRVDIQRLEERLQEEREERGRLEAELGKLQRERAISEEQREQARGGGALACSRCTARFSETECNITLNWWNMCPMWFLVDFSMMRDKQKHLEQEVLQYREQLSAQQDKLDFVTKVGDEERSRALHSHIQACVFTNIPRQLSPLLLFSLPGV